MKDYKSVQDLIVKAALYDGVSTTISPYNMMGDIDILRLTFSKGNRSWSTSIELGDFKDHERMALYCCKQALYKLLCGRYEEIEYKEEN
jgi:hypothetical protein